LAAVLQSLTATEPEEALRRCADVMLDDRPPFAPEEPRSALLGSTHLMRLVSRRAKSFVLLCLIQKPSFEAGRCFVLG
jgi:hypothetical protein